jgi:hypothetical protein
MMVTMTCEMRRCRGGAATGLASHVASRRWSTIWAIWNA